MNLSFVPFLPTQGLSCVILGLDLVGCIIIAEETGNPVGRMVVVHHDPETDTVTTYTPNRREVEICLDNYWTRQRALHHIQQSVPGIPLYSDAPGREVHTLLLRATATIASHRRSRAMPTTPPV